MPYLPWLLKVASAFAGLTLVCAIWWFVVARLPRGSGARIGAGAGLVGFGSLAAFVLSLSVGLAVLRIQHGQEVPRLSPERPGWGWVGSAPATPQQN